ncbi:MAG: glycosyltransferase family 2 protein [Thermoplasmata archaeon]|nr:glycosyltransferase family 2 protein [Thermoplasmata archaeon]
MSSMEPSVPSPDPGPLPVTAVIPVFNGDESLESSVRSVLVQDYPMIEVLIVDDGSRDGSVALARKLSEEDPRVRAFGSSENHGLAHTLNVGLRQARGPLVLLLHQDCALRGSDWLIRGSALLRDSGAAGVVGRPVHDVVRMTPMERVFWVIRAHTGATAEEEGAPATLTLFSENKCDLYVRQELLAVGGFDESFRTGGEDQLLALSLERAGKEVLSPSDLRFDLTLGSDRRLGRGLHKELRYGQQMRSVLVRTRGRAARRSSTGALDPRLLHRAAGVGWILASLFLLLAGLAFHTPWVSMLALLPPLGRAAALGARGVRTRTTYRLRWRDVGAVAALGLLMDLVYAVGFITPDPRRPRGPADGSSGPSSGRTNPEGARAPSLGGADR